VVLYFTVDDVDEAYDALKQRGLEFVDAPHVVARMEDVELRMAFFRDPDGNSLALMAEVPADQSSG
jgi:catechol 2,3-dioxygenase-like lactoylglutathione lyase family enzyme